MPLPADLSYMYHNVRGQSTIKLYVIFNMCEVLEKLFSTVSLDTMDALVLSATRCTTLRSLLALVPRTAFTCIPVICHTLAVLYQVGVRMCACACACLFGAGCLCLLVMVSGVVAAAAADDDTLTCASSGVHTCVRSWH